MSERYALQYDVQDINREDYGTEQEWRDAMAEYELSDGTLHDMYDDMIDEVHDVVRIGQSELLPSRVLRSALPVEYRTGFHDWLDSELKSGNIVDVDEVLEA